MIEFIIFSRAESFYNRKKNSARRGLASVKVFVHRRFSYLELCYNFDEVSQMM